MDIKVAIITGAGRGIGRATAIELARLGWQVVLAARNQGELAETASECPGAAVVPTDVTLPTELESLVQQALHRFGQIDAVVNNAGLCLSRSIEQITIAEWQAILDTNLSAGFHLSRLAWPSLKHTRGVIVNVSSPSAHDPFPGLGYYGVAKAALDLLTRVLSQEGGPVGIRVYGIAPGMTETAMFRGLFNEAQVPKSSTLRPERIARAIVDCLTGNTPSATGMTVPVNPPG